MWKSRGKKWVWDASAGLVVHRFVGEIKLSSSQGLPRWFVWSPFVCPHVSTLKLLSISQLMCVCVCVCNVAVNFSFFLGQHTWKHTTFSRNRWITNQNPTFCWVLVSTHYTYTWMGLTMILPPPPTNTWVTLLWEEKHPCVVSGSDILCNLSEKTHTQKTLEFHLMKIRWGGNSCQQMRRNLGKDMQPCEMGSKFFLEANEDLSAKKQIQCYPLNSTSKPTKEVRGFF